MLGLIRGCLRCILCKKRLKLSRKVDECNTLPRTRQAHVDAPRVRHEPQPTPVRRRAHNREDAHVLLPPLEPVDGVDVDLP